MHVFHLATNLGPNSIGRRLSYLVPKLKALGVTQTVGVIGSEFPFGEVIRQAGIIPVRFPIRNQFDLSGHMRVRRYVHALNPDIVHLWGREVDSPAVILRESLWKSQRIAPHVTTYENRHCQEEPYLHRAGEVRYLWHEAPADRRTRSEARATLGIDPDTRLILAFDHFESPEPIRNAVWAFDLLKPTSPLWRLVILGDGPARPRVQRFAVKLAADDDRVSFLGIRRDVDDLISACDIVWHMQKGQQLMFRWETFRRISLSLGGIRHDPNVDYMLACNSTFGNAWTPMELTQLTLQKWTCNQSRLQEEARCEEGQLSWMDMETADPSAVLADYAAKREEWRACSAEA